MTLFLELFYTFFLIGLLNFGGGGAMVSLIQSQVVTLHGWLSEGALPTLWVSRKAPRAPWPSTAPPTLVTK